MVRILAFGDGPLETVERINRRYVLTELEADIPVKCGGIHDSMLSAVRRGGQRPKSASVAHRRSDAAVVDVRE
jgi:hypothetical protein